MKNYITLDELVIQHENIMKNTCLTQVIFMKSSLYYLVNANSASVIKQFK